MSHHTVAIVTSRLRQLVTPHDAWVRGLRGVVRSIAADHSKLVVGDRTAGSEFVRHAAHRLELPYEVIKPPAMTTSDATEIPARDRVVIEAADLVYVLHLRTGGNLHRLLLDRLRQSHPKVVLVDIPKLQAESARLELLEAGAELWQPDDLNLTPFNDAATDFTADEQTTLPRNIYLIESPPDESSWTQLTHTTRACPGPWPEQSFAEYADSVLCDTSSADHSPLGSLRRIVATKRLVASNRMIRGGHCVVSWTACPLQQLHSLHCFRTHRVRWDFEPYGLCVRRDWLIEQGARPVRYGTEADWNGLAEADQPFFQAAGGETEIDWSVEQEWRHLGDLDLSGLTSDDVLLFVPHFDAAKKLSQVSDWPITLWPAESKT